MNKLYWIVSVVIGLILSSIFLSGAGIEANHFYSAPERISKFVVSMVFSIYFIMVLHKVICAIFKKAKS
ncbi:hypothetical protein BSQ40_02185 [Serratia fonticola]|nr:hypothetical protein BSQ40_02185 [Serratia fonticola]